MAPRLCRCCRSRPGEAWSMTGRVALGNWGFVADSLSVVTRPPLDPARGAEVARELRALGVKGTLVRAAELGYITELTCGMPKCFCPEEWGGAGYFERRPTRSWSYWEPTLKHFPIPKRDGGKATPDNAVLAHRLCNKLDYSISQGHSIEKDLARVQAAREAAAAANLPYPVPAVKAVAEVVARELPSPQSLRQRKPESPEAEDEEQARPKPGYFLLNTDGGNLRRRPGEPLTHAAIGVLLRTRRLVPVAQISERIGPATHNVAEYRALIAGLTLARRHGVRQIRAYTDSELVVDQVNGRSAVRQAHLNELHEAATGLIAHFQSVRLSWVPREMNAEADQLVRDALAGLE
jgi:ribonuclease HI